MRPTATSAWLDQLNTWRESTGVAPLTENTTWSAGDYSHALYMVKNDLVTHYETLGVPYYTTAGDTAARDSNIYVSSTTSTVDTQAIDWWMGAPFHAMGLMDPRLTQTGFGSYREVKSGWQMGAAVDVLRGNSFSGGQFPVYFPGNGTTEPLTSYSGNEFPDPLQACSGYSVPTGLPLFVETGGNVNTTVTTHTLTGNGVALDNCAIDSSNSALTNYLYARGGAIMIPRQPLQAGVKYVVSLTVNGVAYSWSFTVGAFTFCHSVSVLPSLPSPAVVGSSITFTASATGCPNANPIYEFWVLAPGASLYTLGQAYSTNATFNWSTAGKAAGIYGFSVWVRDSASAGISGNASGRWDSYNYSQYTLTASCPAVSDSPSPASPAMAGTTVTFTASAPGCPSPNPLYQFWVLAPGASLYSLGQAYSSTATFSWNTSGKAAGTYAITVWVRDAASVGTSSNSSGSWDAYNYSQYTLIAGCPAVGDSPSVASPVASGTTVVFTASAPGCPNPRYEFWVLAPGASLYTLGQAYSSTATFSWSTAGKGGGTYAITVWVQDAGSTGISGNSSGRWDAYIYMQYTLTGTCTSVSDSPSQLSPAAVGTKVIFTATATGCPNPLYEFWVLAPGASLYTLAQGYSTTATFTWDTTGKARGIYAITVWVRDAASAGTSSNSSGSWDAYNYSQYTVT
jgi:hypothetical protein